MTFKQFFSHYEWPANDCGDRLVLKLTAEEAAQVASQAFKQLIEYVRTLEKQIEEMKNANPST